MSKKAPGKAHRKGLTLLEIAEMFRDEDTAREWIADQRWPDGPHCPKCGSFNVQSNIKHKTMTHRCRDCYSGKSGKSKTMFSLKTGTIMEGSNLKYRAWAVGIYLFTTNIKGVSSLKLRRELGIGQKAAWFMLHRLRLAFEQETGLFEGPVEADETYVGGQRKNMHKHKQAEFNKVRGPVGKVAIAGAKDRDTGRVAARTVERTDRAELQYFVTEHAKVGAAVFTDDHAAYRGLSEWYEHEAVNHSAGEYVRGEAHTQGIESFWAMLKRAHKGVYHKMSPKHMDRYVAEFSGRHNVREADTIDQMSGVVAGMAGKRLRYRELIADNGLASGARS